MTAGDDVSANETVSVALHAEQLKVGRRKRITGTVRLQVVTDTREQEVAEDLVHEQVTVVRVPIGQPIESWPPVRVEGDTTIVPVVEEVLVTTRRLILREEVHLTKVRGTRCHAEAVTLRAQRAIVTREPSA